MCLNKVSLAHATVDFFHLSHGISIKAFVDVYITELRDDKDKTLFIPFLWPCFCVIPVDNVFNMAECFFITLPTQEV